MKLLCFVLLVAAVAAMPNFDAAVQTMNKMMNSIRTPRLQADPLFDACLVKMMAMEAAYPNLGECQEISKDGIFNVNETTATKFCSTFNCMGPIRALYGMILSDPVCADYKQEMGSEGAMMMSMLDAVCMKGPDGHYCLPMFDKMGELMPNMSAPMEDAQLAASVCHPCMTNMIDFMARMYNMFPGNESIFEDMPTPTLMRSMMGIMCRRNPATGHYCLPQVQILKSQFDAVDHLGEGSPQFINAWQAILPKMCGDVCLRDFLTGYVQILGANSPTDPDTISAQRALARVMSYCIKDGSEFCAVRMMNKTHELAWPATGCATIDQMADHSFTVTTCSTECKNKFQQLVDETGCCARSLMVNTAPDMRTHVADFSAACGIQWPTVSECIKRMNITVKTFVFTNLKYSWVLANKPAVIASLQRDFAAALKVMPEDVEITIEPQLLSRPSIPYLFANQEAATKVTPKVSANADQQSTIEGNQGSVTFPALSSTVTADAAVDPNKPADYQPDNGAATAFISFAVMAFAILAALL